MERTLSDSAFLVNESRARAEELSKDPFAKLWVDDRVRALWQLYTDAIYPFDPIQLGVRNRFFLHQAAAFFQTHADPVFVNIAAGFSSYPLLFARAIESIEVDLPQVGAFKTAELGEFRTQGLAPNRAVTYSAADLHDPQDRQALARLLESRCRGRSSFVLVEGLTYYLPRTTFAP
jgi:O-methyltransferase involved in polyketide biosynthesis